MHAATDTAKREAPAPSPTETGEAWATLIERAVRGVERGNKLWTSARRKDSLFRVLGGSRSDAARLQHRLSQLVASWDADAQTERASEQVPLDESTASLTPPLPPPSQARLTTSGVAADVPVEPSVVAAPDTTPPSAPAVTTGAAWPELTHALGITVLAALPRSEARGRELADTLVGLQARLGPEGPVGLGAEMAAACAEARRVIAHRQHLLAQLGGLCRELTDGLADLAEDDSWVQGQALAMRRELFDSEAGLTARGVRSVSELLRSTRERQRTLGRERASARAALKASIQMMFEEIAALSVQTGQFSGHMLGFVEDIARADSLDTLASTVRGMVTESRAVHDSVSQTQARLVEEHTRATGMQTQIVALEDEIRRLSSEVSTDPLTQIANRRGLLLAFEAERGKSQRAAQAGGTAPSALAVALIDLDNFKKLNDRLGHANGDAALQFLTQRVQQSLRPGDTLARYGGEEFVVLLPQTPVDEAQRVLSRVQRSLSAELFMSDAEGQVFVTFSAGVTPYRTGEDLVVALERADEALYEAKRSGKNRTCVG